MATDPRISEIRSFQAECQEQMRALGTDLQTRGDAAFTEDEDAKWRQLDEWETEADRLASGLEAQLERLNSLRDVPHATESEADRERLASVNVNTRTDVFADLDRVGDLSSADLKARAESVIERGVPRDVADAAREGATATANRRKTRSYDADAVNRHIIVSSSPEYVRAFEEHIQSQGRIMDPILSRAAMSLTAANGGVLVPQFLDPSITITNAGTENEIRAISGQVSITVDQWDGVTSAGVTAEWLGEGTEAADATPTFVAPTITTHKAAAYVFGSYEVLADSGFDEVGALFMDAKDRIEATAFTTGTGSSQPYGVVTQLSGTGPVVAGSSGAAGAADLVAADLFALSDNLGARWRRNASFLTSHAFANDIRALGTVDNFAFWTHLGPAAPPDLIGYPVRYAEDMDSTIVSGSNDYPIILGDFAKGYKIVDRVGMSVAYNPLVIGSNQRPTGQAGWFAFWRVGADVLTSNAFKTLKL